MSRIKIAPNDSGTGIFTIESPNSNTNRTITLPDNAGNFLTTGSAGAVVQVVHATSNTQVDVTSTTYTDTGISASITPSSSSNKIFIHGILNINHSRSIHESGGGVRVLRDSTVIHEPQKNATGPYSIYHAGTGTTYQNMYINFPVTIYDSPSTTSSVTYKFQIRPYNTANSGRIRVNPTSDSGNSVSFITLTEIVA